VFICDFIPVGGIEMETILQDLRYGVRMLLGKPAFTAVAVLTLALAIGANSAIFSVVNAVLLKPLPYREPGRLVQFWETNPIKGWTKANVAPANFYDWEKQNTVFEEMASYFGSDSKAAGLSDYFLTGGSEPERLRGLGVSANIFSVLGADPLLGRTFRAEENGEGNHRVVVLSHKLWQRRFGGDPAIIGQNISLNGNNRTVVGVMPEDFYFPTKAVELWSPFGFNQTQILQLRRPHFLRAVARLAPGVTLDQARAEMTNIAAQLEQQYPDTNTQMGVGLGLLHEWIVEDTRLALLIFLAAVGFVLLIACANVANLLLARATARHREIAIRTALGSSRLRIIRQLLTESLLLAFAGGVLGLLLAMWAKDLLMAFSPGKIPRLDEISLDGSVLLFTFGITLLTTIVFGLVPALQSSKPDLTTALKEGGQKGGAGSHGGTARNVLIVSEVALALVLVIGAGLMVKSFIRLGQVSPGFNAENLLTFSINLPDRKYDTGEKVNQFYRELDERIERLPGVVSAGATSRLALKGYNWTSDFSIEGRSPEEYGKEVRHKEITADYFETMGTPLVSGRWFNESDTAQSTSVIIINETLARIHFANEDPVGKRLKFDKPERQSPWRTIIGVVKDEKQDGLGMEVKQEIYESTLQNPNDELALVVRTTTDPASLVGGVRSEIRAMDSDLAPFDLQTMREVIHTSLARERFSTLLLLIFAVVAMVLASVGIYGVMSYAVTQRTHEMGVRMALGASSTDILRLVIGGGLKLAVVGVGVGIVSAFAITRVMETLLFGVSVTDPLTFIAVSLLLTAVAALACYIPARRAMKVDPMVALRYE
jgi:putative ABC transport system permease protein